VAEAALEVWTDVETLLFKTHVAIPALNRWLKLFVPLAFWHVATCLGLLPDGMHALSKRRSVNPVLDIEHLVGLEAEDTHQQKQHARMKKAASWLRDPWTPLAQGAALCIIMPLVLFMGRLFDDSSISAGKTVLEFCVAYRSPARRAIQRYFQLLSDLKDLFWLSARGPGEWSQAAMRQTAIATWSVIAGLWFRCILPFLTWPWRLAILVCPESTEQEIREVFYLN
jgi:hypothetical protein